MVVGVLYNTLISWHAGFWPGFLAEYGCSPTSVVKGKKSSYLGGQTIFYRVSGEFVCDWRGDGEAVLPQIFPAFWTRAYRGSNSLTY